MVIEFINYPKVGAYDMSTELLMTPEDNTDQSMAVIIGQTVFEKLAVDARDAIEQPETMTDSRFDNSVTHLGDGQTVPDER